MLFTTSSANISVENLGEDLTISRADAGVGSSLLIPASSPSVFLVADTVPRPCPAATAVGTNGAVADCHWPRARSDI